MTAPLLLAFMLIQAPTSATQGFQPPPSTDFEPVLAAGIKVEVVETPAVEMGAEALPIASRPFSGVAPAPVPCLWMDESCIQTVWAIGAPLGWDRQDYMAYRLNLDTRQELQYNVGYRRGRAMAEAKAARARVAANPPGGSPSSARPYSGTSSVATGSASGGGRSSGGTVTTGTGGGGKSTGGAPSGTREW
jgi:uncharacterized membrane protein YgcG